MRAIFLFTLLAITLTTFGQNEIQELTKPIVEEGKRLYRSEMASWYGTDIFLERVNDRASIGGYISYADNNTTKCIFFSRADRPKVIGTISFDSTYNVNTANIDMSEREFTAPESDLYSIRLLTLKTISDDTTFKRYEKTDLNLIPIISNGEKKVYILTGPQNTGVVIFGNDYLLTFDNNNNLTSKKQLHRNIIITNYGDEGQDEKLTFGTMHSHLPETGDFITATDICTLMLYEKFTKWQQHIVVSAKYISIWNCQTDQLVTTPKEDEKTSREKKKRRSKE